MNYSEIRSSFKSYFSSNKHKILKSGPLVPHGDNSLLFTNAGMVQFKDFFLAKETPNFNNISTAQKCIRAGGKHNDLENVGFTKRHHTFFEMLGNFSFGGYFKEEAIYYAWELISKVYALDTSRIVVTTYETDDESFELWRKISNLSTDRIIKLGDKSNNKYDSDNFWQMADTGPCGPSTEIFFDNGAHVSGGMPGTRDEGDRYVEIWNIVFMQFCKDASGLLHKLATPCVDTGMGLERMAAVLSGLTDNYDTYLFAKLKHFLIEEFKLKASNTPSIKVIVDHIRSISFLLAEQVQVNNEGRGYVLRRIIRRAMRHGYKLGIHNKFLYTLVDPLISEMGEEYPELVEHRTNIINSIYAEEDKFLETIEKGMKHIDQFTEYYKIGAASNYKIFMPGDIAFRLHDTYGFPLDITEDILKEMNISVDRAGFDKEMIKARERSRASNDLFNTAESMLPVDNLDCTKFLGYKEFRNHSTISSIYINNKKVDSFSMDNINDDIIIVSLETCFYAESGGQVGDSGVIFIGAKNIFIVKDTKKVNNTVIHIGNIAKGCFKLGNEIDLKINISRRHQISKHHSVTHLLHYALREELGTSVKQMGSLVDEYKTRFDFSHNAVLSEDQIKNIENTVNQYIYSGIELIYLETDMAGAKSMGAIGLFENKYNEFSKLRVISIGPSTELCGGTHVNNTLEITGFKILAQESIGSGVRRIEAISGLSLISFLKEQEIQQKDIMHALGVNSSKLILSKINNIKKHAEDLEIELKALKAEKLNKIAYEAISSAIKISADSVIYYTYNPTKQTKDLVLILDTIKSKSKYNKYIACIHSNSNIIIYSSKEMVNTASAEQVANLIGRSNFIKGGGKKELYQGRCIMNEALSIDFIKEIAISISLDNDR